MQALSSKIRQFQLPLTNNVKQYPDHDEVHGGGSVRPKMPIYERTGKELVLLQYPTSYNKDV